MTKGFREVLASLPAKLRSEASDMMEIEEFKTIQDNEPESVWKPGTPEKILILVNGTSAYFLSSCGRHNDYEESLQDDVEQEGEWDLADGIWIVDCEIDSVPDFLGEVAGGLDVGDARRLTPEEWEKFKGGGGISVGADPWPEEWKIEPEPKDND